MSKKEITYTGNQILEAIRNEYIKEYGSLQDDEKERDGYFILGFVHIALDNFTKHTKITQP